MSEGALAIDPSMLTEIQLDALREVTNIGCGAAATALSQLLGGRRVNLEVTRSAVLSFEELETLLGSSDDVRATVHLALRGGFEGCLLLAYEEEAASALAEFLVGPGAAFSAQGLSEMGRSALMEVGNIVGSAFLNAVGKVSGLILLPSVPTFVHDRVARVVESLRSAYEDAPSSNGESFERMLVLETRLSVEDAPPSDGPPDPKDSPGLQRQARGVRGGPGGIGEAQGSEAPRASDGPPDPIDGHVIIVPRPEALGLLLRAVGLE